MVFGETGVGKSSVVDMLAGKQVTKCSNNAVGCTLDHDRYHIEVASHSIHIYDSTGLNQSLKGTVPGPQAVAGLFKLIRGLAASDGIDFLVMVIRPEAIKERTVKNYKLLFKNLCQEEVPVAIVITGLEHEETMDDWWKRNEKRFRSQGMTFKGHACVTTIKGKEISSRYTLQSEYDQSKKTLDELISSLCREDKPWRQDADAWFQSAGTSWTSGTVDTISGLFRNTPKKRMMQALQKHAGLQKEEAKVIAQRVACCLTWE